MSLLLSMTSPANSSGDAYIFVPAGALKVAKESVSDRPKSMILTFCPLWVMRMFSGLRSLWMTCLRCM